MLKPLKGISLNVVIEGLSGNKIIPFVLCFEIYVGGRRHKNNLYKCKSWKILTLENLEVDVKYEFNSDNARMYVPNLILAEGKI